MALIKKSPPSLCVWQPIIDLGRGLLCLLDPDDYHRLKGYRWFAKKSNSTIYAVRKVRRGGHEVLVRMHREIVAAPPGMDVHHKHGNSLDNRRSELLLCTPRVHRHLHRNLIA